MRHVGWFASILVAAAIASQTSSAGASTTSLEQLETRFRSSVAQNHAGVESAACSSEGEPLWERVENFFGGRRINASVGFGKEVVGVYGGRVIESRFMNFSVQMGMLVHLPFTSVKDLSWERCRAS